MLENVPLADSDFKFAPPPGVEMVETNDLGGAKDRTKSPIDAATRSAEVPVGRPAGEIAHQLETCRGLKLDEALDSRGPATYIG